MRVELRHVPIIEADDLAIRYAVHAERCCEGGASVPDDLCTFLFRETSWHAPSLTTARVRRCSPDEHSLINFKNTIVCW